MKTFKFYGEYPRDCYEELKVTIKNRIDIMDSIKPLRRYVDSEYETKDREFIGWDFQDNILTLSYCGRWVSFKVVEGE